MCLAYIFYHLHFAYHNTLCHNNLKIKDMVRNIYELLSKGSLNILQQNLIIDKLLSTYLQITFVSKDKEKVPLPLIHFISLVSFYALWDFLMFSGLKVIGGMKWVNSPLFTCSILPMLIHCALSIVLFQLS